MNPRPVRVCRVLDVEIRNHLLRGNSSLGRVFSADLESVAMFEYD
jgi:hypothetical protein